MSHIALLIISIIIHYGFAARAVLRPNREPMAKLTWILVIFILPYIGIAAYLLFGEVNIGPARKRRAAELLASLPFPTAARAGKQPLPPQFHSVFKAGHAANQLPPCRAQDLELMENSVTAVERIISDVNAANSTIHMCYYIWLTDTAGTQLAEAVMQAARRGVAVRVIVDGIGSETLLKSELWRDMAGAGVQQRIALRITRRFWNIIVDRADLRNHRKVTVIDNEITYFGSQNIADPAFLPKKRFAPWVDVLVRMKGHVARHHQYIFASDWMAEGGDDIGALINTPAPLIDNSALAQVFGTGPNQTRGVMSSIFVAMLQAAQKQVVITTPYFTPDMPLKAAIIAAAWRGVEVTMIFPQRNDNALIGAAARSLYAELIDAGVSVFEYPQGLLHAKTLVIDNELSLFGSANMDRRSLELNFENNIIVHDATLATALRQRQDEYLAASIEVTRSDIAKWPFWRRVMQNLSSIAGPIL